MKTGDRLSAWMRQHDLASDRRAGRFSRSEAVRLQYEWIQRNRWAVAKMALFVAAFVPLVFLLPTGVRGFAAGAWLATGVCLIVFQIVLASGTAPRMMGDRGEQYTAAELRRLRRRGWRVMNRVLLWTYGDTDHLAIGPGGLIVIETKWKGDPWVLDRDADEGVAKAVTGVAANARRIRQIVPNDVPRDAVLPLVVLWGGHNVDDVTDREMDGVMVVRGAQLRAWLNSIRHRDLLSPDQIERAWRTIEGQVVARDAYEKEHRPSVSRTPGEWVRLFVAIAFAGWFGLLLPAKLWTVGGSLLFWSAEAIFLAVGWFTLRRTRFVPVAVAWLASASVVAALVAVASISELR